MDNKTEYKPFSAIRRHGSLYLVDELGDLVHPNKDEDDYNRIFNIMRDQKKLILERVGEAVASDSTWLEVFGIIFPPGSGADLTDDQKDKAAEEWWRMWKDPKEQWVHENTDISIKVCPVCQGALTHCPGHDDHVMDGSDLRWCPNRHVFAGSRMRGKYWEQMAIAGRGQRGRRDDCYPFFHELVEVGTIWVRQHTAGTWAKRIPLVVKK